ncbi:MAG: hypothetical protein ACRDQX_13080 [Pseudonocardiaceae bacterium]
MIIGAGTDGLCLAHGLTRAGIPVAVHERDRTRRDGLDGYRVGIDPGGSRALHECLPPELFATFAATCAQAGDYFTMLTEILSMSGWAPEDPNAAAIERSVSRMMCARCCSPAWRTSSSSARPARTTRTTPTAP